MVNLSLQIIKPRKKLDPGRLRALWIVLSVSLLAPIAWAQEAVLEEIIVTATKRSESTQDIAISLTTMTEEALERRGFDSFTDFASSVPGMSFADRGPGQSILSLRGVSPDPNAAFAGNSLFALETVGVYFDGTPISVSSFNPEPRMFDMDRIEVLRGPQGTLFGSGSLSGTLRYISNAPNLESFEGKVALDYSDTKDGADSQEYDGMINIPFPGQNAALRITAFNRETGGYMDNVAPAIDPRHPNFGSGVDRDVNEESTYGGRVQLAWQPTEKFDMRAAVYYQKTDLDGNSLNERFNANGGNNPADAGLGRLEQNRLVNDTTDNEFELYSLTMNYDLSFATLTSETSYMEFDQESRIEVGDFLPLFFGAPPPDGFGFPPITGVPSNTVANLDVESFVQEFRLASTGEGNVDWLVGFYYNTSDRDLLTSVPHPGIVASLTAELGPTLPFPFPPLPWAAVWPNEDLSRSDNLIDNRQWAVFGEIGWRFAERWRAVFGGRHFDFESDQAVTPDLGFFGVADVPAFYDETLKEDGFNPKFSLEYTPRDDWLIYGTVSKGFRLGGFSEAIPPICGTSGDPQFDSDTLWNYELGNKITFNDNLQFNFAAYYIEWEDIPATTFLPGCGFAQTQNAGDAETIGMEGDIVFLPSKNLELRASFSYTDAEYTNDVPGINVTSGSELPLVPEWTGAVSATWFFPVGPWQGSLFGAYNYRDSVFNLSDPTLRVKQSDYGLGTARLAIESDHWNAAVYVDNLFDEDAVTFTDFFILHNRESVIRPRSVGVTVGYGF